MSSIRLATIAALVFWATAAHAGTSALCPGDCDDDGAITVSELIVGVRLALALPADDGCADRFDTDRNGGVSIDELVSAVTGALFGCREIPTAFELNGTWQARLTVPRAGNPRTLQPLGIAIPTRDGGLAIELHIGIFEVLFLEGPVDENGRVELSGSHVNADVSAVVDGNVAVRDLGDRLSITGRLHGGFFSGDPVELSMQRPSRGIDPEFTRAYELFFQHGGGCGCNSLVQVELDVPPTGIGTSTAAEDRVRDGELLGEIASGRAWIAPNGMFLLVADYTVPAGMTGPLRLLGSLLVDGDRVAGSGGFIRGIPPELRDTGFWGAGPSPCCPLGEICIPELPACGPDCELAGTCEAGAPVTWIDPVLR